MSAGPASLAESFVDRLQSLVGLLQEATRYGPTPHAERRYAELRKWLQAAYPHVKSVIRLEVNDPKRIRRTLQDFPGQAPTALETLVGAPTLDAWVRSREASPTLRLESAGEDTARLATIS